MELRIKPHADNQWPLQAVLIRGNTLAVWLREISQMEIALSDLTAYAIPAHGGTFIVACLIFTKVKIKDIGRNEFLQVIEDLLVIPQRATVFPETSVSELRQLLHDTKHLLYPGIGLVSLSQKINWMAQLQFPEIIPHRIKSPEPGIHVPGRIKSFQVISLSPKEILEKMESEFPQKEEEQLSPLSLLEQIRLQSYKLLFKIIGKENKGGKEPSWLRRIKDDFEKLSTRNQNQVDRLLSLLKSDPENGLKYAIPLDETGGSRGESHSGDIGWSPRWFNFSLNTTSRASGSGSVNLGERYYELQAEYRRTAELLLKQGDFQKAAFVYLKLLKNHTQAAKVLEDGGLYAESAAIYLKYAAEKVKAVRCYEQGKMYQEAIDLYKELEMHEKVADLYLLIDKNVEAMHHYEKTVAAYIGKHQYLKAALIYRTKMEDGKRAQSLLLDGWRNDKDAFNCLATYFSNITDLGHLRLEIGRVYQDEVELRDEELFLNVIQHEYSKQNEISAYVRDLAYGIIAARLPKHPEMASLLLKFNKKDTELIKDIIRFNGSN